MGPSNQQLAETHPPRAGAEPEASPAAAHSPQVLVADNPPSNLDPLTRLLESQGYRVLAASESGTAVRIAAAARPDLILLGMFTTGIDRYETCHKLKAATETRDIPVIFIHAAEDMQNLPLSFRAGGADYITKPFLAEEVAARVNTLLGARLLTGQLRAKDHELQLRAIELAATNGRLQEEIDRRRRAETALQAREPGNDLPMNLAEAEALLIKRALAQSGGNIAQAARRLGVNRTRIYRMLGSSAADR